MSHFLVELPCEGWLKFFDLTWLDLTWLDLTWLDLWLVTWLPHAFLPQPLLCPCLSARNSQRGVPKWWNCWNNLFCDPVTLFKHIKIKMFICYENLLWIMTRDEFSDCETCVQWSLWNLCSVKLTTLQCTVYPVYPRWKLWMVDRSKHKWDRIHSIFFFFSTVF